VAPGPRVTVCVPGVVGVHVGAPPVETGCTTKSKTTTDTDTGESASVTKSNCWAFREYLNEKSPGRLAGALAFGSSRRSEATGALASLAVTRRALRLVGVVSDAEAADAADVRLTLGEAGKAAIHRASHAARIAAVLRTVNNAAMLNSPMNSFMSLLLMRRQRELR
jgi:hypothetical protein